MKDKKLYQYEKQMNFIRLMDEAFDENIEEIKKELQDEGIDVKEIQKGLLEFIKRKNNKNNSQEMINTVVCDHFWINTGFSVQGINLMECTKCKQTKPVCLQINHKNRKK